MMMNSSSFESSKIILVWTLLKKQQFSTFKVRYIVLKSANLLHKRGFDDSQSSITVLGGYFYVCRGGGGKAIISYQPSG